MIFPMAERAARYWRFVTDGVMGGFREVAQFVRRWMACRMTGTSAPPIMGFIQIRAGITFAGMADDGLV